MSSSNDVFGKGGVAHVDFCCGETELRRSRLLPLLVSMNSPIITAALSSPCTLWVLHFTSLATGTIMALSPKMLLVITWIVSSLFTILFRRSPISSSRCALSIDLARALSTIFPLIERVSGFRPVVERLAEIPKDHCGHHLAQELIDAFIHAMLNFRLDHFFHIGARHSRREEWFGLRLGSTLYVGSPYYCGSTSSSRTSNSRCSSSCIPSCGLPMCMFLDRAVANESVVPPICSRHSGLKPAD